VEYGKGAYQRCPANQWVGNYKMAIAHPGETQWRYREEAIKQFAKLIIDTPTGKNCILAAGPPSKCRKGGYRSPEKIRGLYPFSHFRMKMFQI
jgi:hypothetical protein